MPVLNVPFVTVNTELIPPGVSHVPVPLKVPVMLVDEIAVTLIVPAVSSQKNVYDNWDWFDPKITDTVVQASSGQLESMSLVPVVVRATEMKAMSHEAEPFGTAATMEVSPSVASTAPAAQGSVPHVAWGFEGMLPLALYAVDAVEPAPV